MPGVGTSGDSVAQFSEIHIEIIPQLRPTLLIAALR